MKSKWYELKGDAIKLRKRGFSIGKIERRLGIPRSTLSGWLKDIRLTPKQKEKLLRGWKNALIKARKKAIIWHNTQKAKRIQEAQNEAFKTLKNINIHDQNILELALAMLYLGEGTKKGEETAISSSDPLILKFSLAVLKNVYNLNTKKIRCELNLRADQNPQKSKRYWSKTLKLPLSLFKRIGIDKRTKGTKTYPYYKGVCYLRCGNIAIQRKLTHISSLFCKEITDQYLGTWRSG